MSALIPYLQIARFDHWVKNIFMLPGVALAGMLSPGTPAHLAWSLPVALLSLGLVASANYVINEWLDSDFDRHHPLKQHRPMVADRLPALGVFLWYAALATAGLGLAGLLSNTFLAWNAALLVMGIIYNVPPLRSKDQAYLDVLSESVNNPLRFMLGWALVLPDALPPSSVLIAYWMGGAYLMATKRYSEFRLIGDPERAGRYRKSFRTYSESSLLISAFFYAMMAAFMLGIFLIKYRVEFLLTFPLFSILFAWYLALAHKEHSAVQAPEKLYREHAFMGYVVFLVVAIWGLWIIDIPALHILVEPLNYSS